MRNYSSKRLVLVRLLILLVIIPTMFYVGIVRVDHTHVGEVVEVEVLPCGCRNVTFSDGEEVRFSRGFGLSEPVPKGWVRIHCSLFGVPRKVESLSQTEIESLQQTIEQESTP